MARHWRMIVAALAALALGPAVAGAAPAVRITAGFDADARLGEESALRIGLAIDPRRAPSPVRSLSLSYPKTLGVNGLGLASCRRSPADFVAVAIDGRGLAGCPPNAVIGIGSARGQVRLHGSETYSELGRITVLAGPLVDGRLNLVTYVDGHHPFGAKLVYAGLALPGRAPYGGALALDLPDIPSLTGYATVALLGFQLDLAAGDITYYERVRGRLRPYKPDGILLPPRCDARTFPFRADVVFQDGRRAVATTTAPCPPRATKRSR